MINKTFGPYSISEHPKFKSCLADLLFVDFMKLGFDYGDSIDVIFSNGKSILDIPFYDGFYTKSHEPLICFHPGYEKVFITFNDGPAIFNELNLDINTKVSFALNTKGKYLNIQNSMKQSYSYDRNDYESDEVFANFRPMNYGELISNLFYRSSSPIKNSENRSEQVNDLIEKNGIKYIFDLSLNKEDLDKQYLLNETNNTYWKKLYCANKILPLNLSSMIDSIEYKQGVAKLLRTIIKEEGPYLINCSLGKDRTGFVCMLIEALAYSSPEEIEYDFMKSFENLHFLSKEKEQDKYKAIKDIKLGNYACYLALVNSVDELNNVNLHLGAINYVKNAGLTEDELKDLMKHIAK